MPGLRFIWGICSWIRIRKGIGTGVERRNLEIVRRFEIVIENLDRSFLDLNGLKIDDQNEPSPFILISRNLISFCNKDPVL